MQVVCCGVDNLHSCSGVDSGNVELKVKYNFFCPSFYYTRELDHCFLKTRIPSLSPELLQKKLTVTCSLPRIWLRSFVNYRPFPRNFFGRPHFFCFRISSPGVRRVSNSTFASESSLPCMLLWWCSNVNSIRTM